MNVSDLCSRIIRTGFYLLFFLIPLVLTPWNYELFEFNKMVAVYALTTIIACAWIVKMVWDKEVRIVRTPLDIPILLFFGSQLTSALFSIDPHVSWFGYYSRFNGGMWSVVCYITLYYAFVTNFSSLSFSHFEMKLKTQNLKQTAITDHLKNDLTIHQFSNLTILLKVIFASGFLVSVYGILERLGIDKHLWVQDVQNRVFSTLGQPNWLGAYMAVLVSIAMAKGFELTKFTVHREKYTMKSYVTLGFYCALCSMFFLTLFFTRSRSALLGFAVADVIFWGLLFSTIITRLHLVSGQLYQDKIKTNIVLSFFLLHFSFFLIIFFNGSYVPQIDRYFTLRGLSDRFSHTKNQTPAPTATPSGTLLEYGGTESGKIRSYVWQGAVNVWRGSWKNYLVGTGTETFAFAFYQYRPAGHNLTSEWDFLYNKAHNEYLNYLATTGILGLGSYLLFIGVFIGWFTKYQISNVKGQRSNQSLDFGFDWKLPALSLSEGDIWILRLALFAGWTSILITNFFGFSVVVIQLFFFLIPAMLFTQTKKDNKKKAFIKHLSLPLSYQKAGSIIMVGISFGLLYRVFAYWQGDTLFASGYRASRAGAYGKAQSALSKAILKNQAEPMYHDELATVLASLSVQVLDGSEATHGAMLAKQALLESDKALLTSPRNVNFWKSRTKIFYALSQFDPSFIEASIQSLNRAKELSPNDPKIYYNLAVLEGQLAQYDTAVEYLVVAKTLKPNYRDVYWALAVFYKELKKPDAAKSILQEYLARVDPADKEFLLQIEE